MPISPTLLQAHLRPQLAYLSSMGVVDLQALVMERPLVLGEGIDSVIKFLRLCGVGTAVQRYSLI